MQMTDGVSISEIQDTALLWETGFNTDFINM